MKNAIAKTCFGALLALTVSFPSLAQTISADRPGFGDGTSTVAPGRLQVEGGYAFSKAGAVEQQEIGQALIRVGLSSQVEVRIALNSYVIQQEPGELEGTGDFGFGLKANLLDGSSRGLPNLAALASTTLPRPDAPFGSDVWSQTFKLAADWSITESAAISANAGYATSDGLVSALHPLLTLSLGTTLPGTEVGAYAGYARFDQEDGAEDWVEAGLTYLLGPSTQIDVNGAYRVDDNTDRFFVGAGIAQRF
ncbi:MAG: transporter [Rhodothermales bacterium]